MNIDYVVANPTGNITVLVTTPVDEKNKLTVVNEMFEKEPTCEQVGFVSVLSDSRIKLEMMGGEFCGNATVSAASYCVSVSNLDIGYQKLVVVESSGIDHPVSVIVKRVDETTFIGTLEMPIPQMSYYDGSPLVQLDGISHLLVPAGTLTTDELEESIKSIANQLDVLAAGIIQYEKDEKGITIVPLVYVPGSNTLVWEHGCASGSIAAAYYNYMQNNETETAVYQPGGMTRIAIRSENVLYTGQVILNK